MPTTQNKNNDGFVCTTALVNASRLAAVEKRLDAMDMEMTKLYDTLDTLKDRQTEMMHKIDHISFMLEDFQPVVKRSERSFNTLDIGYKVAVYVTAILVMYQLIQPFIGG